MSDKTKVFILALLAVAFDGLSQIPNQEKDEALALLKTELDKYVPGEAVAISQLINDLKVAIEAGEDLAGKAELIPPTEKAFVLAESIADGKSFFVSLVNSIFHKHANATAEDIALTAVADAPAQA